MEADTAGTTLWERAFGFLHSSFSIHVKTNKTSSTADSTALGASAPVITTIALSQGVVGVFAFLGILHGLDGAPESCIVRFLLFLSLLSLSALGFLGYFRRGVYTKFQTLCIDTALWLCNGLLLFFVAYAKSCVVADKGTRCFFPSLFRFICLLRRVGAHSGRVWHPGPGVLRRLHTRVQYA
jgi:hypothetical protein